MAILPVGISAEEISYQIERSLRFNSADSAYLNRTPGSAGNKKTFTISLWIKRSKLGASTALLDGDSSDGNRGEIYFDSSDKLNIYDFYAASGGLQITSARVFRDVGSWYHIVFAFDTTQATDSNRLKIYVNGVQESLAGWSVGSGASRYPTQNADFSWNGATSHWIGRTNAGSAYFDGYMTEIHSVDGSQLAASDFGETDTDTGVWKPKAYSGSYGTNGFYLDFGDNSSTTALGYDAAGSNDWTPNNFSVTAGAGNDSLVDSPTRYGTDTGVGGEVRGNYATLNPLKQVGTLANGNLDITTTATSGITMYGFSTIGVSSGKWYFETTAGTVSTATYVGLYSDPNLATTNYAEYALNNGLWFTTVGGSGSFSASASQGDIVGVAVDIDNGTFQVFKNGTSLGTITGITLNTRTWFLGVVSTHAVSTPYSLNFGQRPFAYTAPSGFKALCTTNLPDPTVADGEDYMDVLLWTGNGSTQNITGLAFQPDLVWTKDRGAAYDHTWFDAVRGATKFLRSNTGGAEETRTDSLTSFNSNGFSVGADSVRQNINRNGASYVSWTWKANGSGVLNEDGTVDSTVSANTTAGFSIVKASLSNSFSGITLGHGLGVAPTFIIGKPLIAANWYVYHSAIGNTKGLYLNDASAEITQSGLWNNTSPTSTVFSVGTASWWTGSVASDYIFYAFTPISGFSAFGSYAGSGDSNGPFVYCGFRPRFVLIKGANQAGYWMIHDTARNTYNVVDNFLRPNTADADLTGYPIMDILSNGFKPRSVYGVQNDSGYTYIYAAFAENPFKYALAR